jgi:glutamine synthetase
VIGEQLEQPQHLSGGVAGVLVAVLVALYGGLGIAVALGSGLYGIEHKIEPDPMVEGNAYAKTFPKKRSLPRTLTEASEWLAGSKAGRELFGDEFVEHFAASREWEDREFKRAITDWELARYFEII